MDAWAHWRIGLAGLFVVATMVRGAREWLVVRSQPEIVRAARFESGGAAS